MQHNFILTVTCRLMHKKDKASRFLINKVWKQKYVWSQIYNKKITPCQFLHENDCVCCIKYCECFRDEYVISVLLQHLYQPSRVTHDNEKLFQKRPYWTANVKNTSKEIYCNTFNQIKNKIYIINKQRINVPLNAAKKCFIFFTSLLVHSFAEILQITYKTYRL